MWVPESWFGFQLRMSVDHTHDLVDMGTNIMSHRELQCSSCGYSTLAPLYNISGDSITSVNYPLSGFIRMPNYFDVYLENEASFVTHYIECIDNSAFANQTDVTGVYLPIRTKSIGANAFLGCTALENIEIPSYTTEIGYAAFAGCNNLNIVVNAVNSDFLAQDNILYNKNKTQIVSSGKTAAVITIPDSVTEILPYAFYDNNNLQKVYFGDTTPEIKDYAFAECDELNHLYFYDYSVRSLGTLAFFNDNFTISVPHSVANDYYSEFSGYTTQIEYYPINITLEAYNGENSNISTYYGAEITSLPIPYKRGNEFLGWYDNEEYEGQPYESRELWDNKEDLTLYAKWKEIEPCIITFDKMYGSGGAYGVDVFPGEVMPELSDKTIPTRIGYNFMGYYEAKDGNGICYYDENLESTGKVWDGGSSGTLYAYWVGKKYTVNFDFGQVMYNHNYEPASLTNKSDVTKKVEVTYGSPMPCDGVVAPKANGYTFKGYYEQPQAAGAKYYDGPALISEHEWDKSNEKDYTLYAYWVANEYTVTLLRKEMLRQKEM